MGTWRGSRLLPVLAAILISASAAPPSAIGPEEFAARREALAQRLERGLLILRDEAIERDDVDGLDANTPKYDFYYLTGWEREGSILLLRPETRDVALFVPGGKGQARAAARETGLKEVLSLKAFPKTFRKWLEEAGSPIWTRPSAEGVRGPWRAELGGLAPGAELREVGRHLVSLRLIKSEAEMETMRDVAELGAMGLSKVIARIRPGMREGDVAAAIERLYGKGGAQRRSFPPIVGSGGNGTIIHYTKNSSVMKAGDLVVMDVGAELDHYASDITRTVPVSGRFTDRQREVYQAVLDAQLAAEKTLAPGTTLQELHERANSVILERGFPAIPHFVGHFVGLAVHDSGSVRTPLEPGMVITIEPGVYLKREGIGVRIEDMYLVTSEGADRLSSGVPRTVAEIEALIGRK